MVWEDTMINVKKILFPTDFSDPSRLAMNYAIELAGHFKAHLEIVHIMLDETQMVSFYLPQVTAQSIVDDMAEGAGKEMKEFCSSFPELKDIEHNCQLIKGNPFTEILKLAKEMPADMIVIGTHGRTGLEHMLFGSTAEKVVREAPCPVFTVRPTENE